MANDKNESEGKVSLTKYIVILVILIILIIVLAVLNFTQDETISDEEETVDTTNTVIVNDEAEETETTEETEIIDSNEIETIIAEIEKNGANIFENADIYSEGDFDLSTISNELILKLAWNALVDEIAYEYDYAEDGYSEDGIEITGVGELGDEGTITITQEKMNEKIVEIFGDEIIYTDESFDNSSHEYFWEYRNGVEEVIYENSEYTAEYTEGGGSDMPEIEEYAYEAIKSTDKVEIYVKMCIEVREDESVEDTDENYATTTTVKYYDSYDFSSNDESGLGEEIEHSEYLITDDEMEELDKTYKYTFAIDSETGDYYLSGFCEVTE